jgi:SAM-dependent methyltransferase
VVALDLGAAMVARARDNLAAFGNVRVEQAAFEDWPLPAEPFDLVLSATAWHWVDPAVRVAKARAALRPGGALAILHTHHVAGAGDAFFADVQHCYVRWMPGTATDQRLPLPDDVAPDAEVLPGFAAPRTRRQVWDEMYDTGAYFGLISTYSSHLALAPDERAGLLGCVAEVLDRHGGRLTKRYLAELRVAVRD